MSRRLSMSRIGLAHKCGYWARDDVFFTETPSGRAARVGTLVHKYAEALVKNESVMATDVDLDELADAKAIMDGPFRNWLKARQWKSCEEGLRYDAEGDATKVGPRRGDDGYDDHGPMILKGTLDLVAPLEPQGAIDVIDIKTGQKQHASVDQLYAQAVAAARHHRATQVRVAFVFPRKTKCDAPVFEVLDADRLDEEAGRIHRTLRMIPTSEPEPGDHCWKCPLGRAACPAYAHDRGEDWEPMMSDALAF